MTDGEGEGLMMMCPCSVLTSLGARGFVVNTADTGSEVTSLVSPEEMETTWYTVTVYC